MATHSQKSTPRLPKAVSIFGGCRGDKCHSNVKQDRSAPGHSFNSWLCRSSNLIKFSGRKLSRPIWLNRFKSPLAHTQSRLSLCVARFEVSCICCRGFSSTRGWNTSATRSSDAKVWGETSNTCCLKSGGAAATIKCPAETRSSYLIIFSKARQTSLT